MIQTECPKCNSPLSNKHADLNRAVLACPQCGHTLPLLEAVLGLEEKTYKAAIKQVKGIEIGRGKQLVLKLSPNLTGHGQSILLFGIFLMLATGAALYYLWPEPNQSGLGEEPVGLVVVGLLFVVGVMATLTGIKRLIQYTDIKVDKNWVKIRYRWFDRLPVGGKQVEVNQIQQFFVTQSEEGQGSGKFLYAIKALVSNRREITLVKRLGKAGYAFFIEQKLESYLNIEDQIQGKEYIPNKSDTKYQREQEQALLPRQMIKRADFPGMNILLNQLEAMEQNQQAHQALPLASVQSNQLQPAIYIPCETCGASLADAQINPNENLIQCRSCDNIEVLGSIQFSDKNKVAWRKHVKSPESVERISIQESPGLKLILHPEFFSNRNMVWIMMYGALGLFVLGFVTSLDPSTKEEYFGLFTFLGGLGVLWVLLVFTANLTHRIVMEVQGKQLVHYHRFFGSQFAFRKKVLLGHEIEQLYVRRVRYPEEYLRLILMVRLKNGKELHITDALANTKQGYFLEHQIETHLGIEDQPVPGEVMPTFGKPEQPWDSTEAFQMNRAFFRKG